MNILCLLGIHNYKIDKIPIKTKHIDSKTIFIIRKVCKRCGKKVLIKAK